MYKRQAQKYDVVVANPPYMSVSNADDKLNGYVKENYPNSKIDLYSVFIEKCHRMTKNNGYQSMITMHSWMFLTSFEKLRENFSEIYLVNMVHLGARAFEEIGGEVVQTTSFVFQNSCIGNSNGAVSYTHLCRNNNYKRNSSIGPDGCKQWTGSSSSNGCNETMC